MGDSGTKVVHWYQSIYNRATDFLTGTAYVLIEPPLTVRTGNLRFPKK
jgi:hypothetical protein